MVDAQVFIEYKGENDKSKYAGGLPEDRYRQKTLILPEKAQKGFNSVSTCL